MAGEHDGDADIQLQMSADEFQVVVQDAVQDAILGILVFLLGIILTFAFLISGTQMIIHTPGVGWNIFGLINIATGIIIFWWAVIK